MEANMDSRYSEDKPYARCPNCSNSNGGDVILLCAHCGKVFCYHCRLKLPDDLSSDVYHCPSCRNIYLDLLSIRIGHIQAN
jgi:hypothetical protein